VIDLAAEVSAALAPVLEELREVRAEVAALRAVSPPRLLSVPEAALALGISARSCWRRVKDRSLPSRRLGRSVRIDSADLHAEARR